MNDEEIEALAARVADMVAARLAPLIEELNATVGMLLDMIEMDDVDAAWEPAEDSKKEVLLD